MGEALKKTALWFLGNILFGLVTVILVYILSLFHLSERTSSILTKELWHLLKDGIIVFFFCALMGSVVVDILIDKKERESTDWTVLWLPFIILGLLLVVYMVILFGGLDEDFFVKFSYYPIVVAFVSFIYCFVIKIENFTRS